MKDIEGFGCQWDVIAEAEAKRIASECLTIPEDDETLNDAE